MQDLFCQTLSTSQRWDSRFGQLQNKIWVQCEWVTCLSVTLLWLLWATLTSVMWHGVTLQNVPFSQCNVTLLGRVRVFTPLVRMTENPPQFIHFLVMSNDTLTLIDTPVTGRSKSFSELKRYGIRHIAFKCWLHSLPIFNIRLSFKTVQGQLILPKCQWRRGKFLQHWPLIPMLYNLFTSLLTLFAEEIELFTSFFTLAWHFRVGL